MIAGRGFQIHVLFAAAAIFVSAGDAAAAPAGVCQAYVAAAIQAANDVKNLKCGYDLSNPQWSTDPQVHLRWCHSALPQTVYDESVHRENGVFRCSACRGYAERAVAAFNTANNVLKCNKQGPEWRAEQAPHFNWCMGLGEGLLLSETKQQEDARNSIISQCEEKSVKKVSTPLSAPAQKPNFNSSTSFKVGNPPLNIPKPSNSAKRGEAPDTKAGNTGGGALVKGPTRNSGSSSKVMEPGLLDSGGSPLSSQGPAAAGSPIGSPTGGSTSSPGSGTFRPKGM